MLRLMSIGIVFGAIWLANLAIPDTDNQRRLKRIVGISVNGSVEIGSTKEVASDHVSGRLPQAVFGTETSDTRSGVLSADAATTTKHARATVAKVVPTEPQPVRRVASLMPLPRQKPGLAVRQAAIEAGTVQLTQVASTQAIGGTEASATAWSSWLTQTTTTAKFEPAPAKNVQDVAEPAPASTMTRRERRRVARHLQRELRRVGCYHGLADGLWGARSREAMQAFAANVTAGIATDQPDYVALMLVEKFDARACEDKTIIATRTQRQVAAIAPEIQDLQTVSAVSPAEPKRKPLRTASIKKTKKPAKFTRLRSGLGASKNTTKPRVARPPSPKPRLISKSKPARKITSAKRAPQRVVKHAANHRVAAANRRLRLRKTKRARLIRRQRTLERRRIARANRQLAIRVARARQKRRRSYARRASRKRYSAFSSRGGRRWVRRAFSNVR